MNFKQLHRITAAFVFLFAFVIYFMTMAKTVSFWDCGEFIAISHGLEVSHPPGAPFYMLIGRMFSMFMPTSSIAWSINLISVLCSSFTALLTFLIIVRLVSEWKGDPEKWTLGDTIGALAGGVIGSLTFAFSDSHWFNSVEAEVYAISMFFAAIVIWLIMRWVDQVRSEERQYGKQIGTVSSRWLVLIAYLFGLATGIHLLNLLAVFYIGLMVYYEKFDQPQFSFGKRLGNLALTGFLSSLIFFIIYPGIIQTLPSLADSLGSPVLVFGGLLVILLGGLYYTQQKRMQVLNLFFLCLTVVTIGYSSYVLIFVRSAAPNLPIDENDPQTADGIVSYLKREQYGQTPLLSGDSYNNDTGQIDLKKSFPRRWSDQSPDHLKEYANYSSDWDFFWRYQVGHMYLRYFLWNFSGKQGDFREAEYQIAPNQAVLKTLRSPSERESNNAYYALPLLLGLIGAGYHAKKDWRRAFAVGVLFFVTGIGIIIYLNQPPGQPRERDYAYVASFWAFALWVGIGATGIVEMVIEALRKNKSEEEVTAEAASGLGSTGIAALAMAVILFLLVPGWMLKENYADHNRAGESVAWDYAYNMLNNLEKNAIIFTNGDNDTFPLWYLQEVEGIRQDVRVVNLSLLNTPWYINQLKNQTSRSSAPVPISMDAEQIRTVEPCAIMDSETIAMYQAQGGTPPHTCQVNGAATTVKDGNINITLPVPANLFASGDFKRILTDSVDVPTSMNWTVKGRPYAEKINLLYAADQAVLDILNTNAKQGWKRPIYFAVTVSADGLVDAQNYMQLEGLATRFMPIKHNEPRGRIVPSITVPNLQKFRFTNLNNPNVYFDDNVRTMTDNYRTIFTEAANKLSVNGRKGEAKALLDNIQQKVSMDVIPPDFYSLYMMADAYQQAGDTATFGKLMSKAEPLAFQMLESALQSNNADQVERAQTFTNYLARSYAEKGDFAKAAAINNRIADIMKDPSQHATPEELKQVYQEMMKQQTQPQPADTTK